MEIDKAKAKALAEELGIEISFGELPGVYIDGERHPFEEFFPEL